MNPELGIMMLGLLIVLILLGFPIAFTLIAMAFGFGYYAIGPAIFNLLVQRTFGVMSNQVLIAVPLFLFMGYMVERANILDKLFKSLQTATSAIPGSLAVASLITCALFATATGIVGAVVTLMGLLALPAMLNAGYDKRISSGVICAGGCLGILIPPSIMLILYGATSGVSVVRLYAAAIFPGLLLAGLSFVYIIVRAWLNPSLAPKPPKPAVPPSTPQRRATTARCSSRRVSKTATPRTGCSPRSCRWDVSRTVARPLSSRPRAARTSATESADPGPPCGSRPRPLRMCPRVMTSKPWQPNTSNSSLRCCSAETRGR